jgi:starch synthase
LYWDPQQGKEYDDNLFRFALLSLAATEAPFILKFGGSNYGDDVVFIANDWQTGLVPVYLHHKYKKNGAYLNVRSLYVIHNLGYQGKFKVSKFPVDQHLGLPSEAIEDLQGEDLNMGLDCMNLCAAAIRTCDRVLTVSPNYSNEIQTPEGGNGLHDELKAKGAALRFAGVLNGISDEWSPVSDPHIPRNYGMSTFGEGKQICKSELQKELGLFQDPNVALLGFCGRLCYQKGIHLIVSCIDWLMQDQGNGVTGQVQIILMGKGDALYSQQVHEAESKYNHKVCGYVGFDPKVEHRMMAGCDFLLMPSQYEPCGLPQMYAQQYATLPIVHETGGLKDTVKGLWDVDRDRGSATGFLFGGFSENPLKERLYQAVDIFRHDKALFRQMQENAIRSDFYWPKAMDEYERHIDYTCQDPPYRR